MTAARFNSCYNYKEGEKKVMKSFYSRVICSRMGSRNRESYVRFMLIFSDKTATTLQGTWLVYNPVYNILLNVSLRKKQRTIDIVHALVGFLPKNCIEKKLQQK